MNKYRRHLLVIFCITFAVYYWSSSRTVVLEDDGFFILAAYFNGIAHPPGYPLYTILAHAVTKIPFGTVAFRVHLLSGVFASISCVILWLLVYKLLNNRICAYASAISLAFSNVFWSQAIISEVYTLNSMLILIILLLTITASYSPGPDTVKKYFLWTMLVYGLAVSNHWPLVALSTPMFFAAAWPVRKAFLRNGVKGSGMMLLGLLPYAWMILRSNMNPEISFYGPIRSLYDFWFYISRQAYHNIDASVSAGWHDRFMFCKFFLLENYRQFGLIGFCFLITGFIYQWKVLKKHLCLALILGYLGSSLFLILLLDFDYDQLHRITFRVYPIISYVVASIWIGIGLLAVCRLPGFISGQKKKLQFVPALLCVLTTASTFAVNLPENYRANDKWAETYARAMLHSLPEHAILFLDGDVNVGPVGYLNLITGYRRDVTLYGAKGQVFGDRLFQFFKTSYNDAKNKNNNFIRRNIRPIYYTGNFINDYGAEFYGLYWKVLKDKPKDYTGMMLNPGIASYLETLRGKGLPWDAMERIHYFTIMYDGCKLMALFQENFHGTQGLKPESLDKTVDELCDTLLGSYVRIDIELDRDHPDYSQIEKLMGQAARHLNESSLKSETAFLDYYRGVLSIRRSSKDLGLKYLRESLQIWNHPDNPAHQELDKLNEPVGHR